MSSASTAEVKPIQIDTYTFAHINVYQEALRIMIKKNIDFMQ